MTRETRHVARMFALLLMVVSMAIVAQTAGAAAQPTGVGQATSPQTAGTASVAFSDVWVYDAASSDLETAFMTHADLPGTIFIYGEITDPSILDPETGIEMFAEGFFGTFGDGDHTIVDTGTIATDTSWRLYSLSLDTIPFGAYISANTTAIPGDVIITLLVSPVGSFDLATAEVQDGITINGAGTSLTTFDPLALSNTVQGGGPVSVTTPDTSATVEDMTDLTLPPLDTPTQAPAQTDVQLTENVVVNGAEVSWGGDWTYSDEASTPDQIAFFINDASISTFFGYATVPSAPGDVTTSLAEFTDGFFEEFGAMNVAEVTLEALPSGNGYALFTGNQTGIPLVILVHADVTTAPNEFRAQVLITPVEEFDATFASAQKSFVIDNMGAMYELNGVELAALLGTGGPARATVTTTQVSGGSIADYHAADVLGTCDAIGWAAMSPGQLPVTEADIDYRAACSGGAAFVASCGTSSGGALMSPEPGVTWVRCDVTVRVDGDPIAVSGSDFTQVFTLVDGAGVSHPVDAQALLNSAQAASFPTGTIFPGQTFEGSIVIPVPQDAPGPWVIEILIDATGQEPGTLVLDGELRPFEVFGS